MTTVLSDHLRSQRNSTSSSMATCTSAGEKTRLRQRSDQIGDLDRDSDKSSQKYTSDGETGYSSEVAIEDEAAELDKKARSVLRYTGLSDSELDQRVSEFQLYNQGILQPNDAYNLYVIQYEVVARLWHVHSE